MFTGSVTDSDDSAHPVQFEESVKLINKMWIKHINLFCLIVKGNNFVLEKQNSK